MRMHLRKTILILMAVLFSWPSFAEDLCPDYLSHGGEAGVANVQRNELTTVARGCSVKISTDGEQQYTRRYIFSEGGVIEIFNQFGPKIKKVPNNGSRVYFVFPRHQLPTAKIAPDGKSVRVVTPAGDALDFTTDGKLGIADDESHTFHMSQSETVSKSNNGGAEVILSGNAERLVLDCGFSMGAAPFTFPNRTSTFKDSDGGRCTLPNSALFTVDAKKESKFKFSQDAKLYAFLRTVPACKNLKFPPESLSSGRVLKATGPGKAVSATNWDEAAEHESKVPLAQ